MKKIVFLISTIIYLMASTGAMVSQHYCMGNLVSWTVGHDERENCNKCGMAKSNRPKDCCKDEEKFFKNTDDQKVAAQLILTALAADLKPRHEVIQEQPLFVPVSEQYPVTHAPPGRLCLPTFIKNSVFRI